MKEVNSVLVEWPNGMVTTESINDDWLKAAHSAGIVIPTGCLGGSCGACEIDVNGRTIRACIEKIKKDSNNILKVDFIYDEYW